MAHSLLCSDIFLDGLHRRIFLSEDLKMMKKIMREKNWHDPLVSVDSTLVWENKVILITDTRLDIIHATENIFEMNGYKLNEVIGKSPRMFQGGKTELRERKRIRHAISKNTPFDTIITNYKKDGSIYQCHLEG